ncbi:MAG: hypothetical protein ACR2PG_06425 [Hyphomicrobiaceae bacterium]
MTWHHGVWINGIIFAYLIVRGRWAGDLDDLSVSVYVTIEITAEGTCRAQLKDRALNRAVWTGTNGE